VLARPQGLRRGTGQERCEVERIHLEALRTDNEAVSGAHIQEEADQLLPLQRGTRTELRPPVQAALPTLSPLLRNLLHLRCKTPQIYQSDNVRFLDEFDDPFDSHQIW